MITALLSMIFLILQAFGINVIQDWCAMLVAGVIEFALEYFWILVFSLK